VHGAGCEGDEQGARSTALTLIGQVGAHRDRGPVVRGGAGLDVGDVDLVGHDAGGGAALDLAQGLGQALGAFDRDGFGALHAHPPPRGEAVAAASWTIPRSRSQRRRWL
jgi:hypothetical protein